MKDRIKLIREQHGLSRKSFGERMFVSQDVINNVERGRVTPSELLVKAICSTYNVNREWLETGEGEMLAPDAVDPMAEIIREYRLSPQIAAAVRAYLTLPDNLRQAALDAVCAIADAANQPVVREDVDESALMEDIHAAVRQHQDSSSKQ